jgi:hypothetical protein
MSSAFSCQHLDLDNFTPKSCCLLLPAELNATGAEASLPLAAFLLMGFSQLHASSNTDDLQRLDLQR